MFLLWKARRQEPINKLRYTSHWLDTTLSATIKCGWHTAHFPSEFCLMTPNKQLETQRSNFHMQLQEQPVDYYQNQGNHCPGLAWFCSSYWTMDRYFRYQCTTAAGIVLATFRFYFSPLLIKFLFLIVPGNWHRRFCPQQNDCCKVRYPNPSHHDWGSSISRFFSALYEPH